jgi:hypothetical protein
MTRILIEIRGGNIQNIIANENVEIVIVDYDNMKCGDAPVFKSFYEPDVITETGTFYQQFTDERDPMDMEVRDELRRNHI